MFNVLWIPPSDSALDVWEPLPWAFWLFGGFGGRESSIVKYLIEKSTGPGWRRSGDSSAKSKPFLNPWKRLERKVSIQRTLRRGQVVSSSVAGRSSRSGPPPCWWWSLEGLELMLRFDKILIGNRGALSKKKEVQLLFCLLFCQPITSLKIKLNAS